MNHLFENLESRRLLAGNGETSLAIGDTLYYGTASALWKSNLDGSNAEQLYAGMNFAPRWLTNVNGRLIFSAYGSSANGRELWYSNGTASSTRLFKDLHLYGASSDPHDFMWIGGRLIFFASNQQWRQSIWTTDGSTVREIWPGVSPAVSDPTNIVIENDTLTFEGALDSKHPALWRIDSKGTRIIAGARIANGQLRVYGAEGNDRIELESSGGTTTVKISGIADQSFSNALFSNISIYGVRGDDTILLGDDITADARIQADGRNVVVGGSGNDWIPASGTISGGAGNDTLAGSGRLEGGTGNDELTGNGELFGGDDDDILLATGRTSLLDGGAGNDRLSTSYGDVASTLLGGSGNDTLTAANDSVDVSLSGGDGMDLLNSSTGDDFLDGGLSADTLNGGAGADTFASDPADTITDLPTAVMVGKILYISGTPGGDVVQLTATTGEPLTLQVTVNGATFEFPLAPIEDVRLSTGQGADWIQFQNTLQLYTFIRAGSGNDTIHGSAGIEEIDPGAGDDSIDGHGGSDRLDYSMSRAPIIKSDALSNTIFSGGSVDAYRNIHAIVGSQFDDVIVIDAADDVVRSLSGDRGNDKLAILGTPSYQRASLYGGEGADTLTAGVGDFFDATDSADVVYRGVLEPPAPPPNPPVVNAAPKAFVLDQGMLKLLGSDAADQIAVAPRKGDPSRIQAAINGVAHVYNRNAIDRILIQAGDGDDVVHLERVSVPSSVYGNLGNDTIYGSAAADRIVGNEGDDWINGGAGNDTIYGDSGNDKLFGGDGKDFLSGGSGANTMRGGNGVDRMIRQIGLDDVRGNRGDVIASPA